MSRPILVLSNERDFAADLVVNHLRRLDFDVRRLNIETARSKPVDLWSPHEPRDSAGSVIWWRQFQLDQHPMSANEIDDVLVVRAQWRAWLSTLSGPSDIWVNPLWAARRAESKVDQLRTALAVGLRVPRTAVTNDPSAARLFREEVGEAVIKTAASAYYEFSDEAFVFTEMLDDRLLDQRDLWFDAPVTVQESLIDCLDARVVSFGDQTFGARCLSKGTDWRKTPFDSTLWMSWNPPEDIRLGCSEYRASFGLEYAAFDFMLRGDEAYFLEANQAGEWLFIERATSADISSAFARHLALLASSA